MLFPSIVMLWRLPVPFGWGELIKRTVKEIFSDDVLSLAAQQAYYFFFALFPALLTVISFASFFPIENLMDEIVGTLGRFAPPDVLQIIQEQLTKISEGNSGGLLTFAFLVTLWSSSGAMVSIITTLNAAYDITEGRSMVRVRLTAILLTIGMAFFVIVAMALVIVGPALAEKVAVWMHLGSVFVMTWKVLQWPVVFALVSAGIATIYYYAPDAEQDWIWLTPGAVLATALWLLASVGLKLYLAYFGNFNETYGTIGGVMVLLLWFYASGIAILIGAEMNAEIEHASPYGKSVGERIPGEKKKIGSAAERAYEERRAKGQIDAPPFPDDVNCDVDRAAPKPEPAARASELLIGAAALLPAAIKIGREVRKKASEKDAA
ncbi:MAG: YihY/virulence factor BrkB family protein [Acidobacteria bacterium]|nr:YihY/virulence factor BrkB family protein [Acidobacteriota bacterium]